jgi:hypothetical protein
VERVFFWRVFQVAVSYGQRACELRLSVVPAEECCPVGSERLTDAYDLFCTRAVGPEERDDMLAIRLRSRGGVG